MTTIDVLWSFGETSLRLVLVELWNFAHNPGEVVDRDVVERHDAVAQQQSEVSPDVRNERVPVVGHILKQLFPCKIYL